jgi:hypothetical protein
VNDIETKKPNFEIPVTNLWVKKRQMRYQKRSCVDRRSDFDRRREYDLDYFTQGGPERRKK